MGVKNFYPFIRKKCPEAIKTISLESLRGKSVALDGSMVGLIVKR